WMGYIKGYGYQNQTMYDMLYPSTSYYVPSNKRRYTNQLYHAGINYQTNDYASQWLINYQHSKDTNFNSQFGPDGAYHTVNDIEQQGIQWHNQLHWSTFTINFGTEWRQEQITATGEHLVNRTYG